MSAVVESFERGEVDVATFDHRAHVEVAFHFLATFPLLEALPRFCVALQRLVQAHGAEGKFHATLSVALLLLIRDRMRDGESWPEFAAREAAFIARGIAPVYDHYPRAQLDCPEARAAFELPAARMPTPGGTCSPRSRSGGGR